MRKTSLFNEVSDLDVLVDEEEARSAGFDDSFNHETVTPKESRIGKPPKIEPIMAMSDDSDTMMNRYSSDEQLTRRSTRLRSKPPTGSMRLAKATNVR